ncbi:MAG: hypothetical protein V8Q71_01850 [Bacilli bacterium]|jgi:parvulin-like peptidyl-prolyl isomerase
MKKIALAFSMLMIILMSGCGEKTVLNTPTKKVEAFFANYQTLDDNVLAQLDETIDKDDTLTDEQKDEYRELMKKHYKNLKYDVKDEVIDGDKATVTVEIEVTDYTKVMSDADKYLEENKDTFNDEEGKYDKTLFTKYRLDKLKEAKDTVKYTLDMTLTKVDDEWQLDDLSDIDEKKIHGMYEY